VIKGKDFFEYMNFCTYNNFSSFISSRSVPVGRIDIENRNVRLETRILSVSKEKRNNNNNNNEMLLSLSK
jgi:hypothetical protein